MAQYLPRLSRRWLRFSLRSLLLLVLAVSVILGWYVNRVRRQAAAVQMVLDCGGSVLYADDERLNRFGLWPPFCLYGPSRASWGFVSVEPRPLTSFEHWVGDHFGREFVDVPIYADLGFVDDDAAGRLSSNLASLADLVDLQGLKLGPYPDVVGAALPYVARLDRLRFLCIEGDSITDASLVHVRGLTRIETLRLNGSSVQGPGLIHLANMRGLRNLDLQDCNLASDAVEPLKQLKFLECLLLPEEFDECHGDELRKHLPDCYIGRDFPPPG